MSAPSAGMPLPAFGPAPSGGAPVERSEYTHGAPTPAEWAPAPCRTLSGGVAWPPSHQVSRHAGQSWQRSQKILLMLASKLNRMGRSLRQEQTK